MPRTSSRSSRPSPGAADLQERLGLWPLRVLWLLVPLIVGRALDPTIQAYDSPGPVVAQVALWAAWFAGALAVLVPSAATLTVIRILAPATLGLVPLAGFLGDGWTDSLAIAGAYTVVVVVASFLPVVGDQMINGSAYGSERRMALRPPSFALLGPVQLAWLVLFAGLVTGPILLSAGRYVLGAAAVVVGGLLCWQAWRVLHQLARRWLVFVPAGFVIHDHVLQVESVLMRRTTVDSLGPAAAPIADDAVDVSGGAYGLALEVVLNVPAVFGRRINRQVENTEANRLVFTPTLPGAVLREARIRAINVE